MQIHDHAPNAWGRSFLWGGIVLGVLLVAAFLTDGFGLLGSKKVADSGPSMMERQGDKIVVPESSPLRKRLTVTAVHAESVSAKLLLPATVESDPARTAAVLTPLGGRVLEIRVALGDRVHQGQVLAVIDSPDLGQAYDDNDKAADAAQLTRKISPARKSNSNSARSRAVTSIRPAATMRRPPRNMHEPSRA